jgi:tRNA(His) guanylyltransferase
VFDSDLLENCGSHQLHEGNKMASVDYDDLGTRMKAYERATTLQCAFIGQPIIVRLDGKAFHTFTKGMKRPYDECMSRLMVETMNALVEKFHANVGYTQSDEISLVFYSADPKSEYIFGGRFQKIQSLMAAYASVVFNRELGKYFPEKVDAMPIFDARANVVPNLGEAWNNLVWRQGDATKNAISMAAQSMFPHKSLQKLNGKVMQAKMLEEKGVNFNDYPEFFKRGTFSKRVRVERMLTEDEMKDIPKAYRPTTPVVRSEIREYNWWLVKETNLKETIFA